MRFAITHCGWLPERVATLDHILDQIGADGPITSIRTLTSRGREHASIWARRLWEYVAEQSGPVCCLNDDVRPHPELPAICEAIVKALPGKPISLHNNIQGADEVEGPWIRCYWLTGPAYILWPHHAAGLLDFTYKARWDFLARNNEDNVAIHWAWSRQEPFWATIPAPVIHDTDVPSSLGYDHHAHRTPVVPWTADRFADAKLTDPAYWEPRSLDRTPCLPNPWMSHAVLEAVRKANKEGKAMCFLCMQRPAMVGTKEVMLCGPCVGTCAAAALSKAT